MMVPARDLASLHQSLEASHTRVLDMSVVRTCMLRVMEEYQRDVRDLL